MEIRAIIADIRDNLRTTFSEIDLWFDRDAGLRAYRPQSGGWTINEILEHIGLTNHFLLIFIEKGTRKALDKAEQSDLAEALRGYIFHKDKLTEVGLHQSFDWIRPEHMEPKGQRTLPEVRTQLNALLNTCYTCLDKMPNSKGAFYKTTMTVNDLGKIDVYEYIYFLAQHGRRHITQMEKNEREYSNAG